MENYKFWEMLFKQEKAVESQLGKEFLAIMRDFAEQKSTHKNDCTPEEVRGMLRLIEHIKNIPARCESFRHTERLKQDEIS